MKQIYKERLLKLAHLLEETTEKIQYTAPQEIVFFDEESQTGIETHYFRWAFYEVPSLFKEWNYRGEASILNSKTSEWFELPDVPVHDLAGKDNGTVWSAMFFFGLHDPELFLHLFGTGEGIQQPKIFGGKVYPNSENIRGTDIAFNIKELITKNENNE